MLKTILSKTLILTVFLFLILSLPAKAISEFSRNYQTIYDINPNGDAEVTQEITLTNNFSNIYPKSYHLQITGYNVQNVTATDSQGDILENVDYQSEATTIKLKFNNQSAGKDKETKFTVKYKIPHLASKHGQIWQMDMPKITDIDTLDQMNLKIMLPSNFGTLAYFSIRPYKSQLKPQQILTYQKNQLTKDPLTLIFGEFQVFDFKLQYHLNNPTSNLVKKKIPLPHDTNYQTIMFTNINPKPEIITADIDNNWLAVYPVKANQNLSVTITGQSKIFATAKNQSLGDQDLTLYLQPDQYWPVDHPTMQNLAKQLPTATDIYNFVVNHLDYNLDVDQKAQRQGALSAYQTKLGVCTEFSDLFITLARANGIPARELQGFAFTESKEIISLSADNDVLHSWAEYWDDDKNQWVPVDPTWAKTTNGLDFIKNFDLGHFVFVTHGQSSTQPAPPGFYKTSSNQKTIEVDFATEIKPTAAIKLEPKLVLGEQSKIIIKNNSSQSANHVLIELQGWRGNLQKDKTINQIPPLGEEAININSPGFFKRIFNKPVYQIKINNQDHQLKANKNNLPSLKLQIQRLFANLLGR